MGPSAVTRYGKDHHALTAWALACAERVLPYFEEHRPGDDRVRTAIEVGRAWLRGDIAQADTRPYSFAAHAAARESTDAAAVAAARAAGQALGVAHVVGHAPHAAAYAVSAVIAAGGEEVAEMQWQRERCPQRLHGVAFPATALSG
ncbi:MAG: putative immunity protein [Dermatophilaceae bacterium]|jgi:hypothetical protein